MPYMTPSWRVYPSRWRWISRMLCLFGRHHWMYSSTLQAAIACAVCGKKTARYAEYRRLSKESMKRSLDP